LFGRPSPWQVASKIYALIGDCETAALVGSDGSIDWLCWPRFDSGAEVAALVGDCGNGHWQIAARDASARRSRRYQGNTLVLETELVTADGTATLIEVMPLRAQGTAISCASCKAVAAASPCTRA
jgi:GH15 family glucan-1,4-alpha-glucosidase